MERYEILKDIGSGKFGVAKLVRDKWSGELYAVKYIERGQKVLCFLAFISHFSVVYNFSIIFLGCVYLFIFFVWVVSLVCVFPNGFSFHGNLIGIFFYLWGRLMNMCRGR